MRIPSLLLVPGYLVKQAVMRSWGRPKGSRPPVPAWDTAGIEARNKHIDGRESYEKSRANAERMESIHARLNAGAQPGEFQSHNTTLPGTMTAGQYAATGRPAVSPPSASIAAMGRSPSTVGNHYPATGTYAASAPTNTPPTAFAGAQNTEGRGINWGTAEKPDWRSRETRIPSAVAATPPPAVPAPTAPTFESLAGLPPASTAAPAAPAPLAAAAVAPPAPSSAPLASAIAAQRAAASGVAAPVAGAPAVGASGVRTPQQQWQFQRNKEDIEAGMRPGMNPNMGMRRFQWPSAPVATPPPAAAPVAAPMLASPPSAPTPYFNSQEVAAMGLGGFQPTTYSGPNGENPMQGGKPVGERPLEYGMMATR